MRLHRLLLIEDDPALQTLLIEVFTRDGYFVRSAVDAHDALSIADRMRPHVAVVGADGHGTFVAGWHVVTALHGEQPWLPLVMLSTSRDAMLEVGVTPRGKCVVAGLLKPFRLDDLLATVARCAATRPPVLADTHATMVSTSLTV
jgi:DNA-binding NtrC family response regulator